MNNVEMLIKKYEEEIEKIQKSLKKDECPSTNDVMNASAFIFLFRAFINDLKKLNEGIHRL